MNGFSVFLRKELLEQRRTYKLLIMLAAFTLFGMMSALLAKLMPDLFASMDMQGLQITIPEPSWLDAYAQFFKNTTQMGIVVLLLVFSGSMSQELSRGTLTNVLAKGLPRASVVLAKFAACLALWTVSLALAAAVHCGYTLYLFGSHPVARFAFPLLCLWLFGALLLAVMQLTGTLFKGSYGGLLATAAVLGLMLLLGMLPGSASWNPVSLASVGAEAMNGSLGAADIAAALWITPAATALCLAGAVCIFRKKAL